MNEQNQTAFRIHPKYKDVLSVNTDGGEFLAKLCDFFDIGFATWHPSLELENSREFNAREINTLLFHTELQAKLALPILNFLGIPV